MIFAQMTETPVDDALNFWERLMSDPWRLMAVGIVVLFFYSTTKGITKKKYWAYAAAIGAAWIGWLVYNSATGQNEALIAGQTELTRLEDMFDRQNLRWAAVILLASAALFFTVKGLKGLLIGFAAFSGLTLVFFLGREILAKLGVT